LRVDACAIAGRELNKLDEKAVKMTDSSPILVENVEVLRVKNHKKREREREKEISG